MQSVTGRWGSYWDHIRAVEQQPEAPLLCQLDGASWVHSPHRQITNEVHHVTVHSVPSVCALTITVIILRSVQAERCSAVTKKVGCLISCYLPLTRLTLIHLIPPIGLHSRSIGPIWHCGGKMHFARDSLNFFFFNRLFYCCVVPVNTNLWFSPSGTIFPLRLCWKLLQINWRFRIGQCPHKLK